MTRLRNCCWNWKKRKSNDESQRRNGATCFRQRKAGAPGRTLAQRLEEEFPLPGFMLPGTFVVSRSTSAERRSLQCALSGAAHGCAQCARAGARLAGDCREARGVANTVRLLWRDG